MATSKTTRTAKRGTQYRWSRRVTAESHALDLEPGVFTWKDPRRIARSLKRSADHSRHRKTDAFRSAMSMLTFFVNRGGKGLSAARRAILDAAKDELRTLYGRPRRKPAKATGRSPKRVRRSSRGGR